MRRTGARGAGPPRGGERGSLVFIVGAFLALLLLVGLATDLGIVLRYRRAIQNACDAGALAGAMDLRNPGRVPANTATEFAGADMQANNIAWESIEAVPQDVNGKPTGTSPVRLQVTIGANVPLFFLALVRPSMSVAVQCAAQIVPANRTGLHPVGVKNEVFQAQWTLQDKIPCAYNTFNGPPPCGDFALTVTPSANGSFGTGNTGLLNMVNTDQCKNVAEGGANWACVMQYGTGSNPGYCVEGTSGTCQTTVVSKPGATIGPLKDAVAALCATPPPPSPDSLWVVTLPLIDDAQWGLASGAKPLGIVGFAAFELDCPRMQANPQLFTGTQATLYGEFVSLATAPSGAPGGADTGVEAVILVQ